MATAVMSSPCSSTCIQSPREGLWRVTHTPTKACVTACLATSSLSLMQSQREKQADCDSFEDRKSAILLYTRASFTSLQTRESAEGAREVYREKGQ